MKSVTKQVYKMDLNAKIYIYKVTVKAKAKVRWYFRKASLLNAWLLARF